MKGFLRLKNQLLGCWIILCSNVSHLKLI